VSKSSQRSTDKRVITNRCSYRTYGKKTDNDKLTDKVFLRQVATRDKDELRVLDLFAGENLIWQNFDCARYFGVEQQKGKGKNLYADNRRVIPKLDLSDFNVIDVDSYGIPFVQIEQLFKNSTLQDGTVIVYTCIGNSLTTITNSCKRKFGITEMYKESPTLFNGFGTDYFHAMLYDYGVRKVTMYKRKTNEFNKEYGFFTV